MKQRRKICVVVTARPSYSRIKTALLAIKEHPDLELQLVVAASALLSRYGNVAKTIEADGFTVAERVYNVVEGETLVTSAKTTGIGLTELATVLDNLNPDAVVTIADRYETIATAIAAAYMNIPLVHVQGGEVTGSIDEKVRHAITKLADLHFVCTEIARDRVVRMGEDVERVHITGCPSIDLANEVLENSALDFDPAQKYGGVGHALDLSQGYIVVMQHPVTTEWAEARQQIEATLHAVKDSGIPTLWFWPNVDSGSEELARGIRAFREFEGADNIRFFKNMLPTDFLKLLFNAKCLIGNSSVAIRECAYLGVPAINIGSRQEGRERGRNVIDVESDYEAIVAALKQQLAREERPRDLIYGDGKAGQRIADLLATVPLTFEKRLTY